MKRIHNTTIIATTAVLVCVGSGWRWVNVRETRRHDARVHECCAPETVVGMAAQLCQRLTPDTEYQHVEAAYLSTYDTSEHVRGAWSAQCSNRPQNAALIGPSMYFAWNARTRNLMYVCRDVAPTSSMDRSITAGQALRSGRFWLNELQMANVDRSWHLSDKPMQNGFAWVLHLQSNHHKATVTVYRQDGSLQSARVWDY